MIDYRLIETVWNPLKRLRTVNQTSAAYVAKIPKATEPVDDAGTATGEATVRMYRGGNGAGNGLLIIPFCIGANNTTASFRVIGWRVVGTGPATLIWTGPITLAEYDCIVSSTFPGLAGRLVLNTEFFCDTISLVANSGNANVSNEVVSPQGDLGIAHVVVDTKGCDRVEISGKVGTATSFNALVAVL